MGPARDVPLRRLRLGRPSETFVDRLWLLRRRWRTLLRLSLGTSIAFFLAVNVLGHPQGFFAPIAAVVVLIAGAGLRGRTLFELVLGVAIGVLSGELLVLLIGRGSWQMAFVVVLTMVLATLLGLKGLALNQSATSSVLLAAIVPVSGAGNPAVTRFADALLGGVVGWILVLVIPRNPVRDIDREVQRVLMQLADMLERLAQAMRTVDTGLADAQLAAARDMQPQVEVMRSTANNVAEIARMSPVRWSQREHVQTYVATVRDLDNAVRDTRVLARKTSALLRRREPVPGQMEVALDDLARAFRIFANDLSEQDDFEEARTALVDAARLATNAMTESMTINSATIAAQVRSLAADLLYASGYTRDEVDERLDFA